MLSQVENSKDGTIKLLFKEGYHCVLIPQKKGYTLCLSSQVGCVMDCTFCLTAKMNFKKNLLSQEIVEQFNEALNIASQVSKKSLKLHFPKEIITSVVYMGQGEPFANYKNVIESINQLNKNYAYPFKKVTVSTSGYTHAMKKFIEEPFQSHLALSFHSPFQEIRNKLMPSLSSFKIQDLVEISNLYTKKRKDPIMIEYIMIDNLTNRDEDLKKILSLGFDKETYFNLIPLNGTMQLDGKIYKKSSIEKCESFKTSLIAAGYKCFIRYTMGDDIEAACGMLNK